MARVRRHMGAVILWGFALLLGFFAAGTDIFAGTATTSDDWYVADELEVDGSADIAGALAVGGNVSSSGDVLATDDVEAGDDVVVGDDLTVSGLMTVAETFVGTGNITAGDSLYVTTDAEIADKLWAADGDFSDDVVVDDDLTISGDCGGTRLLVGFGSNASNDTADEILKTAGFAGTQSNQGYPALRAGSITGVGLSCNIDSYTPVATIALVVKVNNAAVWTETHTLAATGVVSDSWTQARGTDAFSADDRILVFWDITGTLQYDAPCASLEIVYD